MDHAFFLRCSEDHHNLLLQAAPVQFLHHTSWQVEDVDEIGLGAQALLSKDPSRHVWGFGRHYVGSNFFWYFRDPAGNFAEYYSDMDCIPDRPVWQPQVWDGMRSLYCVGPATTAVVSAAGRPGRAHGRPALAEELNGTAKDEGS